MDEDGEGRRKWKKRVAMVTPMRRKGAPSLSMWRIGLAGFGFELEGSRESEVGLWVLLISSEFIILALFLSCSYSDTEQRVSLFRKFVEN